MSRRGERVDTPPPWGRMGSNTPRLTARGPAHPGCLGYGCLQGARRGGAAIAQAAAPTLATLVTAFHLPATAPQKLCFSGRQPPLSSPLPLWAGHRGGPPVAGRSVQVQGTTTAVSSTHGDAIGAGGWLPLVATRAPGGLGTAARTQGGRRCLGASWERRVGPWACAGCMVMHIERACTGPGPIWSDAGRAVGVTCVRRCVLRWQAAGCLFIGETCCRVGTEVPRVLGALLPQGRCLPVLVSGLAVGAAGMTLLTGTACRRRFVCQQAGVAGCT